LRDEDFFIDDDTRKSVVREALAMRDSGVQGKDNSNQGGFQSQYDIHRKTDTHLGALCSLLGQKARMLLNAGVGDLELASSWVNINESGCWNMPHNHYPMDYVAVYIVQADATPDIIKSKNDGHLILLDCVPALNTHGRMSPICSLSPREGRLMIFPGYVMHMVAPHFSETPRISIAINLTQPAKK
jgi:uncharacterized protein (TIGR02466 family)